MIYPKRPVLIVRRSNRLRQDARKQQAMLRQNIICSGEARLDATPVPGIPARGGWGKKRGDRQALLFAEGDAEPPMTVPTLQCGNDGVKIKLSLFCVPPLRTANTVRKALVYRVTNVCIGSSLNTGRWQAPITITIAILSG